MVMVMTTSSRAPGVTRLQRLLQLTSPALPVGAFAYSEGLEACVEHGWLRDHTAVGQWLCGLLEHGFSRLDLPVFFRVADAFAADDVERAMHWSARLLAARETAERRAQELHQGQALAALLDKLGQPKAGAWHGRGEHARAATFTALFAMASVCWRIDLNDAATGLAWCWLENQVIAAVKLVPLGQTDGQRLLAELGEHLPRLIPEAAALHDDEVRGALPGPALMSMAHERLHTRLFRS